MQKHSGDILHSPRITEKAAYLAESGCYVFGVSKSATKADVARAVQQIYNVVPRKVSLVAVPRKAVRTRGTNRTGHSVGGKKAYVFLKKGEKIEIA